MNESCPNLVTHKITKFFNCIDVKGAGDAFISKCSANVKSISDLLKIAYLDDNPKEKFEEWAGGKNGNKILEKLLKRLKTPILLSEFFALFDLEGFGEKKLCLFEDTELFQNFYHCKTQIDEIIDTFKSDKSIDAANGMSREIKNELGDLLLEEKNDILTACQYFNFKAPSMESNETDSIKALKGKSFCFHGTLSEKRSILEQLVIDNGGKIGGVSKSLSYLVCNSQNDNSSKVKKAKELGVEMITEEEFRNLLC